MNIFPPSLAFWSKDLIDLLLFLRKPSVSVLILSNILLPAGFQQSLGPPGFWVWHFMMSQSRDSSPHWKHFSTTSVDLDSFLPLTTWASLAKLHSFAIHPLVDQTVAKNARMLPSCLFPDANSEIFINTSAHLPPQCSHQWWQVEK